MKKLKSLSEFLSQNQDVEMLSGNEIKGGIARAVDTFNISCYSTMTEWNCADEGATSIGDGTYRDGIIWEQQP